MGYLKSILSDRERVVHTTHQHFIALMEQLLGALFAFLVFLGLGLSVLLAAEGDGGDRVRFVIGLVALGSLILPVYRVIRTWGRGLRGQDFLVGVWRAAVGGLAILAFALYMMLRPDLRYGGWVAIVLALLPLAEVVRRVLAWANERYVITNRRVMEVKGIINKHVRDSALEKVNDVDLKQSVVGRMMGYGSVQIITGSDIGVNMFRRISNPVGFKRAMLNAKEQLGTDSELRAAGSVLDSTADADTIPALIEDLDRLRKHGVLSEDEFQTKKAELLARL